MKIAFINPPSNMPELKYTKRVQRQYTVRGQVFPNTSMAYLAAWVERLGHQTIIVEANALHLSIDDVVSILKEFKPQILAYNLLTEPFWDVMSWIEQLKKIFPGIPVVVGGPQLNVYPEETLTYQAIDYGVIGDGWVTIKELIQALEQGAELSKIDGLIWRADGQILKNKPRQDVTTLDDVPFPARHLLPNRAYTTILTKRWPITVMLTSMGCPFNCLYCDMTGRYVMRKSEAVLAELEECIKKFGIKEVFFQDETFTVNKQRVYEICEGIIKKDLNVEFAIRTRADCVTKDMLKLLKRVGCQRVNFGVETGDEGISRNIRRNIPVGQIHHAVRWAKEAGLVTLAFYILGSPGETKESIEKTVNLAVALDTDYVSISKLVPVPNSELYDLVVKESGIDYWREFTLGNRKVIESIAYYKSNVVGQELDQALRRAYQRFYFRPGYIIKALSKVSSLREMFNMATSAWSLR